MKLHSGCGRKDIPAFVQVDVEDYPHIDFRVPANQLTFAQNNSVEVMTIPRLIFLT